MIREHRHRRIVQFYETDAAGIVHFSWYFRYMEEAEHAMWRAAGLSIAPSGATIGWARVGASFEYLLPLHFEDEVEVILRLTAASRKTISYTCELRLADRVVATGTMKVICVRTVPGEPLKAVDIPSEIAAELGLAAATTD